MEEAELEHGADGAPRHSDPTSPHADAEDATLHDIDPNNTATTSAGAAAAATAAACGSGTSAGAVPGGGGTSRGSSKYKGVRDSCADLSCLNPRLYACMLGVFCTLST